MFFILKSNLIRRPAGHQTDIGDVNFLHHLQHLHDLQVLRARITQLGKVFHSKSATQPGIVRDIELEFEQNSQTSLKPGSAVQVQIQLQATSVPGKAAASTKEGT